jgi:hypothetical protein
MQPIDIRRLQHRISVARKIAVPLVIGQDEDDIGL